MWLNELYHHLNPIIVQIGPLAIRWYGLAYVVGLALAAVVIYRVARRWNLGLTSDDVTSVIIAIAFGLIIGARLFYVVFYGDGYYLQHPLKVFATYEGGMSFHGGLVGAIVGGSLACRKLRISIPTMCDLAVIGAPVGLFFGRCANFINGELWGKPTSLPWGVIRGRRPVPRSVCAFAQGKPAAPAGHVLGNLPSGLRHVPLPDRVRAPAGQAGGLPAGNQLAYDGAVPFDTAGGGRRRDIGAFAPRAAAAGWQAGRGWRTRGVAPAHGFLQRCVHPAARARRVRPAARIYLT